MVASYINIMTRKWAWTNAGTVIALLSVFVFVVFSLGALPAATAVADSDTINRHLQEGNNALSSGDISTAIQGYEACLSLDSNHRYCNINLASALVDANESEAEEGMKRERMARAISLLRHVLTLFPKDGDAAFNLALLLQDTSNSEETTRESAQLYQIAVEAMDMDPEEEDRWDALANMAAAKQELREYFGPYGARRSYERAIVLLEGTVQEYNTYIDQMVNRYDSEKVEYDHEGYEHAQMQVNTINAYISKLYYGYGTILSEMTSSECFDLMKEESLLMDKQDGVDEKSAKIVCETNAVNAMRLAVDLDLNNVVAEHMLASMTGGGSSGDDGYSGKERASNEFVSALFDDFADTFDEKLGALGYKVPQLIGDAAYDVLNMSGKEAFVAVLDAGCGTGLAGRFLRPLVGGPLVGVDLSTKMLELAAECTITKGCGLKVEDTVEGEELEEDERSKKPLYDRLVPSDLETATLTDLISGLSEDTIDGFDLIVAADVFVYLGNLQEVLLNFAQLSNGSESKTSFLIFSCERIDDAKAAPTGWKLQSSGRYAHSKSYVTDVAKNAGFDLIRYDRIVPRIEKGEEVQGHLFVFAIGGVISEGDVHVEVTTTISDEL
jgi:predicted TPR repeat methyltransferase